MDLTIKQQQHQQQQQQDLEKVATEDALSLEAARPASRFRL